MSKHKFKKIVNKAFKMAAFQFLIKEKETKSKSKMSKLEYVTLELQPYLKSDIIFNRTKKFVFRLRTRMVKVGHNFGKKNRCKVCSIGKDDQEHLMQCLRLKLRNPDLLEDLNYKDIFDSDIKKQGTIGKILEKSFRIREEILDKRHNLPYLHE